MHSLWLTHPSSHIRLMFVNSRACPDFPFQVILRKKDCRISFVLDGPSNFMNLDKDSIVSGVYLKSFCDCTLAISQV